MNYCCSTFIEEIRFFPENARTSIHIIRMHKGYDLLVVSSPSLPDFELILEPKVESDYDRVRLCIMDAISQCKDIEEMPDCLDKAFQESFADLLIA